MPRRAPNEVPTPRSTMVSPPIYSPIPRRTTPNIITCPDSPDHLPRRTTQQPRRPEEPRRLDDKPSTPHTCLHASTPDALNLLDMSCRVPLTNRAQMPYGFASSASEVSQDSRRPDLPHAPTSPYRCPDAPTCYRFPADYGAQYPDLRDTGLHFDLTCLLAPTAPAELPRRKTDMP